jgi:DNA-binding LacI/PurR family transcriptional regulator
MRVYDKPPLLYVVAGEIVKPGKIASAMAVNDGHTITLRDVARVAGVSATTVSRILNGRETGVPVREETRQRILDAATELGYRPNLLARGLRGSSSSLVGVIARDISDPFHIQVLRGINEVARARDYRLFLGHADYRADVAVTYGSMFERSHADGILVIGDIEGGDAALEVLAEQHHSLVGVTDRTSRRRIPGVYGDSVIGVQLALDHLWELGHRRIMCVSDLQTYDGRLRIEVYERYMREHGAADQIRVLVVESPGSPAPSYALGQEYFANPGRDPQPTAIWATSDTIAIGLMQAAFQAGVAIPQQLSIVGLDDIDVSAYTIPPLTTVSQTGEEMGRTAAGLLLDMIDRRLKPNEVDDIVLEPHLTLRQSTAPVRS